MKEIDCVDSLLVSYKDNSQGIITDIQHVQILGESIHSIIDHGGLANMDERTAQIFLAEGSVKDIRPFNDILVPIRVVDELGAN